MRLVRLLPQRWRCLVHEMLKFGIVGGINTVVDFLVFNVLLPIGPLKANVVSTVVATTTSYGMNRHWTYRERARSALRREYVLFFLFNLAGFVIQSAVLGVVKYGLHFTEDTGRLALNLGKAAGIGVAMVFRFWAYRTFVFRVAQLAEATATAPPAPATAQPAPVAAPAQIAAPALAGARVPGTVSAEDEFAQLTGPLEAELAGPDHETSEQPAGVELDVDVELEVDVELDVEFPSDDVAAHVARSR